MSFSTAWECSFPNIMGLRDYFFFIAIVLELPGQTWTQGSENLNLPWLTNKSQSWSLARQSPSFKCLKICIIMTRYTTSTSIIMLWKVYYDPPQYRQVMQDLLSTTAVRCLWSEELSSRFCLFIRITFLCIPLRMPHSSAWENLNFFIMLKFMFGWGRALTHL